MFHRPFPRGAQKNIQMKKSILLSALLFCVLSVFSQSALVVRNNEKGLHLVHKVAPKETYYSMGRLYNLPPKEIATFNNLDMNQGLQVDQTILIPLNATNFSQVNDKGRPVYYVVGAKEGLYRVSQNNNDVLMANLRKWNKLTKDNISAGQKLIVGYLVSTEAGQIVQQPEVEAPKKETAQQVPEKDTRKEPALQKKEEVALPEVKKPEDRPMQVAYSDGKGGYFRTHFESQVRTQPAKSEKTTSTGIFKTASGWQDAKYYALVDGVEPGTIIKIVNPVNSKVVYAKVLGEMSGIRQNVGYDLRISNAAASALDIADTEKFIVKIMY